MADELDQEQRDYLDAVQGMLGKPDDKHGQDVRALTTLFAFMGIPAVCVRWLERIQGYHRAREPVQFQTLPLSLASLIQAHYETILEHEKQAKGG